MTKTSSTTHTEKDDPHWIEWLTGIVCACLVLAMLVWMGHEALRQTGGPPDLSVRLSATEAMAGGTYRVTFDIANAATTTAAAVNVRGEIIENGQSVETSDVTFDYVPAESKTEGALIFSMDPGRRELRLLVMGYTEP